MNYDNLQNAYQVVEHFSHLHELHEKVVGTDMSGELTEQELIFKHLPRNANVLELGGNIGRASIVISKLLKKPQHHVVLESDPVIAKELIHNKHANHCKFKVITAALSDTPMIQNEWNARNVKNTHTPVPQGWKYIPTITLDTLKEMHTIPFNALVADCEGCLGSILRSYPSFLDKINTIIIENDAQLTDMQNHKFIQNFIQNKGFHSVDCRELPGTPYSCFFQVWKR
jgi:FkbM family methyltransferase